MPNPPPISKIELYDLEKDPLEKRNIEKYDSEFSKNIYVMKNGKKLSFQ